MISVAYNNNFALTFENGFGVSVGIGLGHYCSRRDLDEAIRLGINAEMNEPIHRSASAEVLITDSNTDEDIYVGTNHVITWVGADELAQLISIVSKGVDREGIKREVEELEFVFGVYEDNQNINQN